MSTDPAPGFWDTPIRDLPPVEQVMAVLVIFAVIGAFIALVDWARRH